MQHLHNTNEQNKYWTTRYQDQNTGWDIGGPSAPLVSYINQLTDKSLRILIPGAGNAHEAQYLWRHGFHNVWVMDVSAVPLENFQARVPDFPSEQLVQANFFDHNDQYDLILEQTFFCSFEPHTILRKAYGTKVSELLVQGGKLVGLWFDIPLVVAGSRPYGGTHEEYLSYLVPPLKCITLAPCYNSIKPRAGKELFGIFQK